jgi:hypothetical protein
MTTHNHNGPFARLARPGVLALIAMLSGCAAGADDAATLAGGAGAPPGAGGGMTAGQSGEQSGGTMTGEPGGSGPAPESDASAPSSGGSGGASLAEGGALGSDASSGGGLSVVTNRYDNGRSGANTQETRLTQANVNKNQFGLLFSRQVDGQIYGQPLYLSNQTMPDKALHNVVFVTTAHNSVYAFDADNGAAAAPLWQKNLGSAAPVSSFGCTDMTVEAGITSTPVIDPATGTIYLVTKGQENGGWVQRVHALDTATGNERPGSPAVLAASVAGNGAGSKNGMISFDARIALNRSGLLLKDGVVYMAFASHCDQNPYHGWVLAYRYDGTAFQLVHAFSPSPNGSQGGIWQGGVGMSADADSIYMSIGNGSTNPNSTPPDVSESVVRLDAADFTIKDYWMPTNYAGLNGGDADLSTGAILLPHNLLITGSKDGRAYLLDSTNLGKFNAGGDKILQTITTPGKARGQGGHLHGGPIYYKDPATGTEWVYLYPEEGQMIGYKLNLTTRKLESLVEATFASPGHPGGVVTLSTNGSTAGTGILWASVPKSDAWHQVVPGALYAVDATDISHVLWSSDDNGARDAVGNYAKFCSPTVANGHVYLATFSNALRVYGPR